MHVVLGDVRMPKLLNPYVIPSSDVSVIHCQLDRGVNSTLQVSSGR